MHVCIYVRRPWGRKALLIGLPFLNKEFTYLLTSPLKPLKGIQGNLTGKKISMSCTKFVFFGLIGKTRWPPWPLIGWDINIDFTCITIMWSVLTAFFTSSKLMNRTHWNLTWQEARSQCPLPSLYFSGQLENQDGRLVFWLANTFLTSTLNQSEFNETWQETRSQWPLPGLFLCPRHKYGWGI